MNSSRQAARLTAAAYGLTFLALHLSTIEAGARIDRPTPTPLWAGLLDQQPVPLQALLPAAQPSNLDGTYARRIDGPPQWWSCLRCADYRPTGGTWRILIDRGVLRILYDVTRWRTLASIEVEGDELHVFNDPYCPEDEGVYRVALDEGALSLKTERDDCAFGLRAANLTTGVWSSCAPPDLRAAASDAWPRPEGCARDPVPPPPASVASVSVNVMPGDARTASSPLEWTAAANAENVAPPDGVALRRDSAVVAYGLNMVLWEDGRWIEMTTDRSAQSLGVQFWGPASMGIARVLFDSEEVWRGEVAQLGRRLSLYGGYVEVAGFAPGRHTLRVEHLGADERPVTVLFFGGR